VPYIDSAVNTDGQSSLAVSVQDGVQFPCTLHLNRCCQNNWNARVLKWRISSWLWPITGNADTPAILT
jgi:hypothetical protein